MSEQLKKWFLAGLAGVFLALFAGVWLWVGFKILFFSGSASNPTLSFSDAQVSVAGFLAAAVGAGTASVLGIEIQKITQADSGTSQTLAAQVGQAAASSWLLVVGIALYALVGCFVLIAWFFNSDIAPEMVSAFSLGVLGWLAGAFAGVFRTGDN